MYVVYKHTTPSGKVYIGITGQDPEKRWGNGNRYKQNKHFYSAIEKYGWDNIKHEIVCTGLNKWQACRVEQSLIKYFDSTNRNKGYNHSTGGECGAVGVHPSAETRRKLSEAEKGANNPWYGKHHSIESRRKMSEAHKGANHPNYGKHLSVETRRKIGEANKGKPSQLKGTHRSAETRRKISEANKGTNNPHYGKHLSAEHRLKISESLKGVHRSIETRRKLSEAGKRAVICVETGTLYSSITEAAKSIGRTQTAICSVLRGATKTSGGYHWRYADDRR